MTRSGSTSQLAPDAVLLGTVALEPNRWGGLSPDRAPHLRAEDWLAQALAAGFDGIELWEHHAMLVPEDEVERLRRSPLPLAIFSSYASFDEPDDAARENVAMWAERLGCEGVKFNVGNDRSAVPAYIERLSRFADALPERTRLLCECHQGTAADDPAVAAEILSATGDAGRLQALVHLGDEPTYLGEMFDALGSRITHVHVNFLRQGAPALADIEPEVRARVEQLRSRGFAGSYTIEFVNGVGGDADHPASTLEAAVRDLAVLRAVLRQHP